MYLSKSLIWKNFVGVHDSFRIKHLQTRICKFERFFILYFLACLICFIRKTAESDFEKWIKFLFLKPRPCSAEMLPLDSKFWWPQKKNYGRMSSIWSSKGVRPVTAGPLIEEGLNAIHHLLAVLGSCDVKVHVAIPHVPITNHPGCTLPFQALLDFRILGYTLLP